MAISNRRGIFLKQNGKKNTVKYEYGTKRGNESEGNTTYLNILDDNNQKREFVTKIDEIDSMMGFDRFEHGENDGEKPRKGWLCNMHTTTIPSDEYLAGYAGVDYYFLDSDGGSFKVTLSYDPYFYIEVIPGHESEVETTLKRFLESCNIKKITQEVKEDLGLPNHLVGLKRVLIKLSFHNISDLLNARRLINPIVKENKMKRDSRDIYQIMNFNEHNSIKQNSKPYNALAAFNDEQVSDPLTLIDDIREYDVPYHVRVSIDNDIRIGKWYNVYAKHSQITLEEDKENIAFADPIILAFDIETTKAPLKFPDPKADQVMMISYMIDGEGFLITNREIISENIEDFEYTPKPEYPGSFTIFNEPDEKRVLLRFYEHVREMRPTVIATFNGDFFDWPFIEKRSFYHDIDMFEEIGFAKDREGEYKSKYCTHMDCFRWVKRDSYLPQGSQGLKAVTTAKLGYNPTELDPELMTPYAYEKPQMLAEYSVSDAVATYYLYYKYVHPFIFSLCTIIPLNPDEVLRKGTGTLCEMLLMVQAYVNNIVLPNKHSDPIERFYEGHLLESETYVGGHVESLEAGVFRCDLPNNFKIDPAAIDELLKDLDNSLKFCIQVENKRKLEDVTNYEQIYDQVKSDLINLKENPVRNENPLIYHVDVASMYPNIMTSNRLQPDSMKTEEDCAACDFNRPGKNCDRRLPWAWRGEYYPPQMNEYSMIKRTLQSETFPSNRPGFGPKSFEELSYGEQANLIKKRLSEYSKKVYHRLKQSKTVTREAIICQRENPFYVNTVRSFRDRRYEFKGLAKVWKGKSSQLDSNDTIGRDEAKKMIVLYDSLQLAHKVILNSFYGYVMRKGSRWYSMEMAGITCLTGATIIQMARSLVERIGRPLELDTDGIWCILPQSFPENYYFKCKDDKKLCLEYPCSMLNYLVHSRFTNHQYQDLVDPDTFKYMTRSENSIFFEVDGPYKAMILPTSKEEGKGLKKRYAVFNHDGTLAELKGFELKRRGELQLIKNFQSDIFKLFLEGETLEGCYAAVASVANNWLDVLQSKGGMLEDEDLIELICENRSMSKSLEEYGNQKSTSITTAKRLSEFLGDEMTKDAGLACKYIISSKPFGSPVTERAVPVSIFSSERKEYFLKKWLKDQSLKEFDPRSVIDWDYYLERLSSVIQKIITIPAALQGIKNPVPRVDNPDWLQRRIKLKEDKKQQSSLASFFLKATKEQVVDMQMKSIKDIEDFGTHHSGKLSKPRMSTVISRKRKLARVLNHNDSEEEERRNALLKGPCPSITEDYASFLQYQKAKWKVQEKNRERRQKLFGYNTEPSLRSSIGDLLRKQAENIAGVNWQILEYKIDPSTPGDVKIFVIAGGKVHSFVVHIPRKIFASFKTEVSPRKRITGCEIEKSVAILPNGQDGSNLYKLTLPENIFQDEMLKVEGLLQDSNILGLYETQVSPVERAIIELGSVVKFDDTRVGALGKGLRNGFNLKDLVKVENATYLRSFNMDIVFLLHLVTNSYEFFAVFKSWDKDASIFVLKPSNSAQELPSNLNKIYKELYESKKEKVNMLSGIITYMDEMNFEIDYFNDKRKIFKRIEKVINKIHESRSSKALLALQSPYPSRLLSHLDSLYNFPIIKMSIGELLLPAIGWQSLILKRIFNHYFVLATWVKKLISLSKYSNIPLCNLQVENINYLIDIEYARRLSQNNIVLWVSPSPLPDHGGFEHDSKDNMNGLDSFTINNPEIYETACLEIQIKNLTINTILTSSIINEAEGTDLADDPILNNKNHGAATLAEDTFSTPALGILRILLREWWSDALNFNENADIMLNNLALWVQCKESLLYDYALHYHVHNLTNKSLIQLLGEFKRMNARAIFGNRNKLILLTSKLSVENSYAYGQYILNAARSKPLFSFLDLNIEKYWDTLIWMDEFNYGGRCCTEITNSDEQELEVVNKWHIREFLPRIYQNEFEDWLIIFLDALVKQKYEKLSNNIISGTPRKTQISHIINQKKNLELPDKIEEILDNGVIETFRKPLEKRIDRLAKRQVESILNSQIKADYEFPKLPGSHLALRNPTLQLVKSLCAVFALSRERQVEVGLLRRELLAIFEVKEFSAEGSFVDPSASLKVTLVICGYCSFIRDIDFCKDKEEDIWKCVTCRKPYKKVILEEQLISLLNELLYNFFNQDLECSKCHQVRSGSLNEFCSCSGRWVESITYLYVEKRIQLLNNIARAFDFQLLSSALEELRL